MIAKKLQAQSNAKAAVPEEGIFHFLRVAFKIETQSLQQIQDRFTPRETRMLVCC